MRQSSSNAESAAETRFLSSISSSSIRSLLPRSISSKRKSGSNPKIPKSNAENTPPTHSNIQVHDEQLLPTTTEQLQSKTPSSEDEIAESEASLLPSTPQGPPVKVVVRIRPAKNDGREGDQIIKKVSSDTVCIGDRQFAFDLVFDSNSNQEDIFQSVGIPLVKNALGGYNTSLLSYGQAGSGKSYTMWGPPSAMVEEPLLSSHQGIVPRIFRMLFSELDRKQHISEGKQFNYQCRCSFVEIYNEQIGDLLDPIQRNPEPKDDSTNALYVENLTEKYVSSYEDVTQILIKGLSSRKVGATSLNSESSKSHIIFTFVVESWCKGTSSKAFSRSKTSKISLIDLAGLDKNEVEDAGRQSLRESGNAEKSLFQLGCLADALTKEIHSTKVEDIPNRNSCLTRLLKESLGGNAKLSVICSICPDSKSNGETLQTLRFGQQVRSITNEPVINEIKEDGVNDLGDQIRNLKEELIRAKANVHSSIGSKNGYFQVRNVRESLKQLRVSLNRSLVPPHIDNDTDEEVKANEDDIRQLHQQINELYSSREGENLKDMPISENCVQFYPLEESCDADMVSGDDIEKEDVNSERTLSKLCYEDNVGSTDDNLVFTTSTSRATESPILDEPPLSESPKIRNTQRKSWNNVAESSSFSKDVLGQSFKQGEHMRSPLQSSKVQPGPTESLAASLQRGLQIIDYQQRNSVVNKSSASFSFEHLTPCPKFDKVESSVQAIEEGPSSDEVSTSFLCPSCGKRIFNQDSTEVQDSLNSWNDAVEKAENPDTLKDEVPKNFGNGMAKATKREKELEVICKEQRARIEQLNQLMKKYQGEKEINSVIVCGQEINRQPTHEEYNSLKDEDKLLRGNLSGNNLLISEENCEIKEVQEALAQRDNSFDVTEKEALLKEIQNLRSKLQLYSDAPVKMSTDKLRSSLMSRSIQLRKSGVIFHDNGGEELEKERQRWTEMESEWICLTDELRVDLESNRQRAERVEMELRLEKKCTEELDDALKRAVLGHARMLEHYAELQEKYDDMVAKHGATMEGIAEVKKAAAKAGKKGHAKFAKSLAAELSTLRVEREREREFLKKENRSLKIQLRDTAEAVHAAGELLVRLREAEYAVSVAEENSTKVQEDNEKLKKQMEKLKRKYKTEMITMKQYLAESKLPESALQPLYREDSDVDNNAIPYPDDDQAWRAEFGAIYQEHY